ncbi:MAG: hypothetical protein ABI551_11790 [Polyangiaceae bacterium]
MRLAFGQLGLRRASVLFASVLSSGACAHGPRPPAASEVARAPRGSTIAPSRASIYRSGSRYKLRWVGTTGPHAARIPFAIVDTELHTECKLDGDDPLTCIPIGTMADDEKIAFLGANSKGPALIVDDDECVAARERTADDEHLWMLSPFIAPLNGHPESFQTQRYRLDAARRIADPWTMEGPGCVVHVEQGARGPLCVRPFRLVSLPEATLRDVTLGAASAAGGKTSGVIVASSADGALLPLPNLAYIDARDDIRCSVGVDDGTCLPPPFTHLDATPVVGHVAKATSYVSAPASWASWEEPQSGRRTWARLAPGDPKDHGNVQDRLVLSLLNLSTVVPFASRFEGAGRIVVHARVMPDGRSVPVSLYDTKLRRDCTPMKTDSGEWRCVVSLSYRCTRSQITENGVKREVLTGSTSFCHGESDCCQGGPVWIPSKPGRGPRRFGMNGGVALPATPERAIRFAETGRMAEHIAGWQEPARALVLDRIEDVTPDVFARLEMFEDR